MPIRIASCVLRSGVYRLPGDERPDSAATSASVAYENAGIGPDDLDAIELHDAMARHRRLNPGPAAIPPGSAPGSPLALVRSGAARLRRAHLPNQLANLQKTR